MKTEKNEIEDIKRHGFDNADAAFIVGLKPQIEAIETHCEMFDLPSGLELTVYCDLTFRTRDPLTTKREAR